MFKIIVKTTDVQERIPSHNDLMQGELAINLADKKIYTRFNDKIIDLTPKPTPTSEGTQEDTLEEMS